MMRSIGRFRTRSRAKFSRRADAGSPSLCGRIQRHEHQPQAFRRHGGRRGRLHGVPSSGRCRRTLRAGAAAAGATGTVRDERRRTRRAARSQAGVGARGDDRAPRADRPFESKGQRHRDARRRTGDGRCVQGRRGDHAPRPDRRAARPAGGAQRPRGHGRDSYDARIAVLPRPCAVARRAHRDEDSRGGRDHRGQDEHAGVRRRIADLQYRVRGDAQSLRPDEDVRRQQRRRGDGGGRSHAADRRWQ